ncbi:hypothetical protein VTJ83DRAFT_4594 [Remersonia thermophila]|uniref:Rhodopsin domain-containing protein n=1 Tax=Remersonia thermophila TaxID=72144 RepID=A0ABR4DCK5_9PEZI
MASETPEGGPGPQAGPAPSLPGALGAPDGPPPSTADLDHDTLGPNMLAAAAITWTIALVFVVLRFYTRMRIVHKLGLSDWTILLSLLAAGGYCVALAVQISHGLGRHVWDVDPSSFVAINMAWWFTLLFYVLTLSLTKVSICLLYLTIFTFEWAQRAAWVVLVLVVGSNLTALVSTATFTIPLKATWDPAVVPRFRQSPEIWWVNTALAIVTDFLIFLLPIPFLAPLKLPLRQKVILVGVFAIGFFVCLVSLIRLSILISVTESVDPDFTYSPAKLTYWTIIESHTAIVVACAMTLKPLAAKFFPGLLGVRRGSNGNGPAGAGGDSFKDDGSGLGGSDPPLTIGSRPTRPLQVADGQHEHHPGVEAVMYGTAESGLSEKDADGNGRAKGYNKLVFGLGARDQRSHPSLAGNDGRNRRSLGVGGYDDGTNDKRRIGPVRMPSTEGNNASGDMAPPSPALGDGASERTDPDLGRVATARSIG